MYLKKNIVAISDENDAVTLEYGSPSHVILCIKYKRIDKKQKMENKKYHVLIVGAGASGLAAAAKLKNAGIDDFLILEARTRTGGRIHSLKMGNNKFIEMGAQWIHGVVGNVAYQMAKSQDLLESDSSSEEDNEWYA
jgi:ribulose 1,5-bisphosphate synthetase/thiazole synthase